MRPLAAFALAASIPAAPIPAFAAEAAGQVLAFSSCRGGTPLFEPRVAFAERRITIAPGDALVYDVRNERTCADAGGVEIVFTDGRRLPTAALVPAPGWTHVRIPLDALVGAETERFELVARGSLSNEIGFHVDAVAISREGADSVSIFQDALSGGRRFVRDDVRQAGAALVDAGATFDGLRTVIDGQRVSDPWHPYDLSNLRRAGDGEPDPTGPAGDLLVGPAVPMRFAPVGERAFVRVAGQKFAFEPLEGGRFYTLWFALSTTDGAPLTTRLFAFGEAGERRVVELDVPSVDDLEHDSFDLGGCRLVRATIASQVPLRGIEFVDEPRLRLHGLTFQWHKDGAVDAAFQLAWLRHVSQSEQEVGRQREEKLRRWVDDHDLAPMFAAGTNEPDVAPELFASLLAGEEARFDQLLRDDLRRRESRGQELSGLRVTLEDVRGERSVVRIESGIDPESMLDAFVTQAGSGVFVLEGDPAMLRQAPQLLHGLGRTAVLLPNGPKFARWSAPDGSSVHALTPFRVLRDVREFGELPWRPWKRAAEAHQVVTDLLLAVDGAARTRGDAAAVVRRLAGLPGAPVVRATSSEAFAEEAGQRLGAEFPVFAPGALAAVRDDEVSVVAQRAPALRQASDAVARLSILATPAALDGAEYPTQVVNRLFTEARQLGDLDPRAAAERVRREADRALAEQLEILARGASTLGRGTPIVVFNPLPWARRDWIELDGADGQLFGADGAPLAWQERAGGGRVFALEVPALGYEVVRGLRGHEPAAPSRVDTVTVAGWSAHDGHLGFEIDPLTGALTSLRLERGKQETLAVPARLVGGDWSVLSAEFVEKGPVRAVARVVLTSGTRRVDLEYTLAGGTRRLEVVARVHGETVAWRLAGRNSLPRALLGVPFGSSIAAPHDDGRAARHRIGDWAATTDGTEGIGVLSGGLATVLVEKDALALELQGDVETGFALVPFAGGWRKAVLANRSREYRTACPLIVTDAHEGARAPRHSFFSIARSDGFSAPVEGPESGVSMTAFRPTADGGSVTIRLAETHGLRASVALSFDRPVFGAETVDLLGRALHALKRDERRVNLELGQNQIQTVRVRLRP